MYSSLMVTVVFTIVFAVTGGYSLVRLASQVAGTGHDGEPVIELAHLLMSLAMIGMTWGWSSGPGSNSGIVQILVFGLLTAWFAGHLLARDSRHGRSVTAYHLIMNAAMVWMVAAMPLLMAGMSADDATGGGHHDDMADMPGMSDASASSAAHAATTPGWATAVSLVLAAALAVFALSWAWRAARGDAHPAHTHDGNTVASIVGGGGVALAVRPTRVLRTGARLDSCCHLLMSLGMASMLFTMR